MTAEDLALLKRYMHVDHDDDDALILHFWDRANRYLDGAGASTPDPDDRWVAAAALTLSWYDGTPMPDGLDRVVNQLKLEDPAF